MSSDLPSILRMASIEQLHFFVSATVLIRANCDTQIGPKISLFSVFLIKSHWRQGYNTVFPKKNVFGLFGIEHNVPLLAILLYGM